MKERLEKMGEGEKQEEGTSRLDFIKSAGPQSRKTPKVSGMPVESMLAVYQGRFTYTFIVEHEVASIHFDQLRREIFYKGHKMSAMDVTPERQKMLKGILAVLSEDERGRHFIPEYAATLDRLLADNVK